MRRFNDIFSSEHKNEKVPLYRSYGVWRKSHPVLDKIIFYTLRSVVLFVLSVLGLALFATLWSLLLYADTLIATLLLLGVLLILCFVFTRSIRKRLKLLRKLKKFCKTEGYSLKFYRSFLRSFKWDTKKHDFVLETDKYIYYVNFLTINKYTSTLTFSSPEYIEKVAYPLNNKFTLIFEFRPKRSKIITDFDPLPPSDTKIPVRAILVNPVCREMFEASKNGGVDVTGNGMEKYGYTVFTGSGFTGSVKRNEEQTKGKSTKRYSYT